jgi:hypothetical protein
MAYENMGAMMTDEAPAAPENTPQEPTPEESAAESEPTAELPKSVLGGQEFKPGDEVTLRVVQVTGNSVLVSYAGGEEEMEAPPPEAPMPAGAPPGGPPGGGMGALME